MEIFVIDAGNTSIKCGRILDAQVSDVQRFALDDIASLLEFISSQKNVFSVISSVISEDLSERILAISPGFVVRSTSKLPINSQYESPETLGMDRLCNAVAVAAQMETEFGVSIDVGTCIKFDLVHKEQGYLGGSIAPGIDLRYKALNDYTEKLPLLSNKTATPLVGTSTKASIHSGVINGIEAEINGFVKDYESRYEHLTFFMTGGDASYFDIHSKNVIFADENLTLKGLFEIYRQNA